MELFEFKSAAEYEKAMLRRYENISHFINNKSGTFKIVCNPKGVFYGNTVQKMIGVKSGEKILCQCVLIKHSWFDALTVGFFEAEENAGDAVRLMMERAADFGRNNNAGRMIIAMDGHCNYGVGFLSGEPSAAPLFGESRNSDYYNAYFENGYKKIRFSGYWGNFDDIYRDARDYEKRIKKHTEDIQTQCADFRQFNKEIDRYTDLSNKIFDGHWYYYPRCYGEDIELFKTMKPLLSPCNLIFATKNGKDIGHILCYPDFNELVPIGNGAGVGTFIKHKLLRRPIRTIKIAEIAVIPEYRSSGTIIKLFAEACRQTKRHYSHVERVVSSWIMDDNTASKNITTRFAPNLYGSYAAYEKEI